MPTANSAAIKPNSSTCRDSLRNATLGRRDSTRKPPISMAFSSAGKVSRPASSKPAYHKPGHEIRTFRVDQRDHAPTRVGFAVPVGTNTIPSRSKATRKPSWISAWVPRRIVTPACSRVQFSTGWARSRSRSRTRSGSCGNAAATWPRTASVLCGRIAKSRSTNRPSSARPDSRAAFP